MLSWITFLSLIFLRGVPMHNTEDKGRLSETTFSLYSGNKIMVMNEWGSGEIKALSPLIYYLCTTVVHVERYIISCTYTSLQRL